MMKKMFPYMKNYRLYSILCPIMMCLEVMSDLLIPYVMSLIVDVGIKNSDMAYVIKMIIVMVVLAIFGMLMGTVSSYFGAAAGYGSAAIIREEAFSSIQQFSFANLDKISIPSLITRITGDTDIIGQVMMMTLRMAVRAPLMMIFGLFMAIRLNPTLSQMYLIVIPIVGLIVFLIMKRANPLFTAVQGKVDRLNAVVQENLIGIRVIKAFNRQDYEVEKFEKRNGDTYRSVVKAIKNIILMMPALIFTIMLCIIGVIWIGGGLILKGQMTSGELIAFITYNGAIIISLMFMSFYMTQLTRANASAGRIWEVLTTKSEIESPQNPILEVESGDVEFKNVNFAYPNTSDYALKDINFKFKHGETIGIIGSTGSSKSSLVQLIPRLYDVQSGSVLVGGHDVREYDIRALRNKVAMVLQKNTLVSGTIRSNMLWGNEKASDEDIIEALKKAEAWEFVSKYSDTIDHKVNQGGSNFSGGQRQRLTIARAMMAKPKILILDDSMSALDMATDKRLRDRMMENREDFTIIVVAQRIASIKNFDHIIVIEDGAIESIGRHEELLEKSPIYREISESQEGGIGE